jgi:Na+/H+ antiporter NhaA
VALKHVLGASIVAAVGFTVPLYFTEVAFDASPLQAAARVGLLAASVVGFAVGVVALLAAGPGEASEEAGGGPGGLPLPS